MADADAVPATMIAQRDLVAIRIEGTVSPSVSGVLASLLASIAKAGIRSLVFGTHTAAYVIVRGAELQAVQASVRGAGHRFHRPRRL